MESQHDQALASVGVSTVYEASGRQGLIEGPWIELGLRPVGAVSGPAYTVRCHEGDNRALHEAVPHVNAGDVLVIAMDPPAPVAVLGELMMAQLVYRGVAGVIVDAGVRDLTRLFTIQGVGVVGASRGL